jgi:hypothetical protein
VPTTMMQASWMGERVATVDVSKAISNVLHKKEDAGWGPNAIFRFPTEGGTGAIWQKVAKLLPAANCSYGPHNRMTALDLDARVATFQVRASPPVCPLHILMIRGLGIPSAHTVLSRASDMHHASSLSVSLSPSLSLSLARSL